MDKSVFILQRRVRDCVIFKSLLGVRSRKTAANIRGRGTPMLWKNQSPIVLPISACASIRTSVICERPQLDHRPSIDGHASSIQHYGSELTTPPVGDSLLIINHIHPPELN